MLQIKQAAGIVLFAKTKPLSFLLLKHRNRWDLPKGHAESGEDLLQTALRETAEETGIDPLEIVLDPSFRFETDYDVTLGKQGSFRKHVTYYLGFVTHQLEVKLTEHIGYQWFTWPIGPLQAETIDPLLAEVSRHFSANGLCE